MSASPPAARDLLLPDPEEVEPDDEDLEALRLAALSTLKPKAPAFVVQTHAKNQNLLAIVPVETEARARLPPDFDARVPPPGWQRAPGRVPAARGRDASPYRPDPPSRRSPRARSPSDVSEYSEYSEYVTDSEAEPETALARPGPVSAPRAAGSRIQSQVSQESQKGEEEDVLQVDCTEEIDEFTNFLNEFEEELKDGHDESQPSLGRARNTAVKKRKRIVKRRKKTRPGERRSGGLALDPVRERRFSPSRTRRYSRSPRRSRSPFSRRKSPVRLRGRSPHYVYRRSPARRASPRRSGSPRGYSPRARTPSPRRFDHRARRSPPAHRISFDTQRSGSAPRPARTRPDRPPAHRQRSPLWDANGSKSRSLPPVRDVENNDPRSSDPPQPAPLDRRIGHADSPRSAEKRQEADFQHRLRKLSPPARERWLARRAKFAPPVDEAPKPVPKVISLKNVKVTLGAGVLRGDPSQLSGQIPQSKLASEEVAGESISLSVDDTLDMFQENERTNLTDMRPRLHIKKVPETSHQTDLRVQLHRRRQRHERSSPPPERKVVPDHSQNNPEASHSEESSNGDSSDDNTPVQDRPRPPREIKRLNVRGSRRPSEDEYTDPRNLNGPLHNKVASPKKRSVMDRLGEPVHKPLVSISVMSSSNSTLKRKVTSSPESEQDPEPPSWPGKVSKSSPVKKKKDKREKKEKKKAKKAKKEKKKKRKELSDEDDGGLEAVLDPEEEELFSFFEKQQSDTEDKMEPSLEKKNIAKRPSHIKRLKQSSDIGDGKR